MTATSLGRRYFLGSPESRSVLGRRELGEVAVIVGGVGAGVAVSLLSGGASWGLLLLAIAVALAVTTVFAPFRGRTLYRWLPVDLAFVLSQLTGQWEYSSGAKETGVDATTGRPLHVEPPPAVGPLTWLVTATGSGPLAVLVQRDGAVTLCLEVEGPGLGLADVVEQETAGQRWGGLLRDLANGDGLVQRLSLLERCVPVDPQAHQRYIERYGWVAASPALERSYDELTERVGSISEQHRNYCVLRLRGGRDLVRAVRAAGGGEAGLAAVAVRQASSLTARLEEAGVRVVRPLGEAEIAALIGSSYGPWRSVDDVIGVTRRDAWPHRARARDTCLEADGWLHATAWIKAWPLVPVGVDFLAPLLVQTPGVLRTVAVTLELVPTDVAMGRVMTDLTSDTATAAAAARAGRTADPRDGRQLSQAEQRAADVAAGAAGVRLVGYVTVSAQDEEELETARRQLRAASARAWLSLEWCDREQDTAFINTLPLARGLR